MQKAVKLCKISELKQGKAKSFKIDDFDIALVNLNSKIYALSNICPHQHTRIVNGNDAIIEGENIVCPMHGWTFEIKTGKPVYGSGKLKIFEVEIKNDEIWVKIDDGQN